MFIDDCNRVRVERHFLGEVLGEEKQALRLHLEVCAKCSGQMTLLENERRNYLITQPFREFAAKNLPGQLEAHKRRLPGWLPTGVGVLACLLILPVLEKRLEQSRGVSPSGPGVLASGVVGEALPSSAGSESALEGVRSKGNPILEFYCKRDGVVHEGRVTEEFRAGDELQFVYAADSAAYVTLASIDAGGAVSLYRAPGEKIKVSVEAKPGNRQALPFAVTLDASVGPELFVMVYSAKPLTSKLVDSWLKLGYTQASAKIDTLAGSLLSPPLPQSKVKALLLKKTKL